MLILENFIKTFSTPDTHVSCTTDVKTESKMELQMEKIQQNMKHILVAQQTLIIFVINTACQNARKTYSEISNI